MVTTNYARVHRLPPDLVPISISLYPPGWWSGRHLPALCPSAGFSSLTRDQYDDAFRAQLARLDADRLWCQLNYGRVALVCYESPNVWCHRRMVAEWFERQMGVEIPEFGFARSACLPYYALPTFAPEGDPRQLTLF
ncbi:MAG: hypothetical protein NT069_03330 [Planctomycetota bacterium]|nr:hypothetical protein [Planctomycetota bacterium]